MCNHRVTLHLPAQPSEDARFALRGSHAVSLLRRSAQSATGPGAVYPGNPVSARTLPWTFAAVIHCPTLGT